MNGYKTRWVPPIKEGIYGFARPAEVCVLVSNGGMEHYEQDFLVNQCDAFFKCCVYMGHKDKCLEELLDGEKGVFVVDYFGKVLWDRSGI